MKNICILLFLVSSTLANAHDPFHKGMVYAPELSEVIENSKLRFKVLDMENIQAAIEKCSVTASGRVHTANGSFTATLTVYGACNSSLAGAMRDAIQALRALFN